MSARVDLLKSHLYLDAVIKMSCKNIILLLLISEKTSMKYWIDESLEICRFA